MELREHAPLRNDLTPAAVALNPGVGDWIEDLGRLWATPVLMSGSGPALFGFFPTLDEATDAAGSVRGARATAGAEPTPTGRMTTPG